VVSKVYYLNSDKYPVIVEDVQQVKKRVDKKEDENFTCVFEALPQYRRLHSIPSELQNGQTASALGMASLALINFPEDCRDIKSALRQVKCLFTGEKFEAAYDYTKHQHPFSFFRGTMLKDFANPAKSNNPELAEKLFNSDKTLAQSKFGKKLISLLGVKKNGWIETKIHAINSTKENPVFVNANIYKGKSFGKLTAHALERTTKWGLIATSLLEAPSIVKAFSKGDSIFEKGENGAKQIAKSGLNFAATTAGMGYIGAIGAKFGPAGSLIGMGAGAIIGSYGSKKVQGLIS